MEAAVIQFNGSLHPTLALVKHELVVQAELALWRPGQIGAHEDVTIDISAQDRAYGLNERAKH